MQTPLYFHIRDESSDHQENHTYCIDNADGNLVVGYAVVHGNDQFNKKTGRKLAHTRMRRMTSGHSGTLTGRIHPVIEKTLPEILNKAGLLLGLSGKVNTIICGHNSRGHNSRTRITRFIDIKSNTQMSDQIMHDDV